MAPRLGLLAVPLALLAFAPAAHAAKPKPATVAVAECDADTASATFESTIRTVPGAVRLQVRFSLQARGPSQPAWAPVKVPGWDTWLSSKPGKRAFVYDKTLEGLAPGEYRVVVRYRWKDATGDTVRTATRRSKACEQPDPRADLVPQAVRASGGRYTVTVANLGAERSVATTATLKVGGLTLAPATLSALDPDESTEVVFSGAPCSPGDQLVATVDPGNAVDEADEAGNVLTTTCS